MPNKHVTLLFFWVIALFCVVDGQSAAQTITSNISVSGNTGAVQINASATFPTLCGCCPCDACPLYNNGSLIVYYYKKEDTPWRGPLGEAGGDGSAQVSAMIDAGVLPPGEYIFVACAYINGYYDNDCIVHNDKIESSQTIFIDNTPSVTVNNPGQVEGAFEISGTANFKESSTGYDGNVYVYVDGIVSCGRSYDDSGGNWKFNDSTECRFSTFFYPHDFNAGTWPQGQYTIRAVATAANGQETSSTATFTVDNTPKVSIIGPQHLADNTVDILGTVTFKESVSSYEGDLLVELYDVGTGNQVHYSGGKRYDQGRGTFNWKFSEMFGALPINILEGKELMVRAVATAANGAKATVQQSLMIPARGCPQPIQ